MKKRKRFKPLPCPFCGCKTSHICHFDSQAFRSCDACNASVNGPKTAQQCNEQWNTRK